MRHTYTAEQDNFIRENVNKAWTTYDLAEMFTREFPEHPTTAANLQKRMQKLGVRMNTHNIRPHKVHSTFEVGHICPSKTNGHARVKTDKGYVSADKYFKELYFGNAKGCLIHLNGDYNDFSRENIELVSRSVYSSLHWRKWIFNNPELTRTAILTARLLEFFPDYRHNENQYLGIRNRGDDQ